MDEKYQLIYLEGKPVLKTTINGSEVTVKFAVTPQPKVKENIIEILTSCYEGRLLEAMERSRNREAV